MQNNIIRIAIGTGLILLIPLALQLTIGTGVDGQGFNWKLGDFIFAFVLIFGTSLAFELVRKGPHTRTYKVAVGIALVTAFFLVWVNAAVGIIGDDNPANMLYPGVVAIGFIGTIIARLEPRAMSYTLFAMAAVQMFVPLIALFLNPSNFAPGVVQVFILNAFFAAVWVGSALLFRQTHKSSYVKMPIWKK